MIAAGLNDDPRPMISRLNDLLTKALEKHWELDADMNSAVTDLALTTADGPTKLENCRFWRAPQASSEAIK